ncbi:MAG: TIGR03089 family protein [Actinomycetia bacterium]|nr:TIGR03089 family protein [Actinomycetes bacterium]
MTSTSDHLRRALSDDPSGPRLTFYDDATGERIELSTTTLANWVAKTVNLLTLECGVGPGSLVSLHLPRHWTTAVWVLAADAVGAEVNSYPAAASAGSPVDVAVIGPDLVDDPPQAEEVFAVSLAPLAAPFTRGLPTFVRDYTLEVRAMPDQVSSPAGPPGPLGTLAEARAAAQRLEPSDRVAALGDLRGLPSLIDDWLAPLAVGASVLWVRNPDPDRCVPRWVTEQVTAVSSTLPNGVVLPEAIRLLS